MPLKNKGNSFTFLAKKSVKSFTQQKQSTEADMTAQKKVVIVGGGTMGADVSLVFLRGGYEVEIIESGKDRREFLPQYLSFQAKEFGLNPNSPVKVHENLNQVDWPTVDLVVECIPEQLPLKQVLFAQLDKLAHPKTILASNSSSFPISQIAIGLSTAERMIGLHFFMPAHLVPCVEVIKGEKTSQAVMDELFQIMTRCLMVPVRVNKDLPGFLANRLQHAMSREAFSMIDQGIASPEDIDNAVRFGFGGSKQKRKGKSRLLYCRFAVKGLRPQSGGRAALDGG